MLRHWIFGFWGIFGFVLVCASTAQATNINLAATLPDGSCWSLNGNNLNGNASAFLSYEFPNGATSVGTSISPGANPGSFTTIFYVTKILGSGISGVVPYSESLNLSTINETINDGEIVNANGISLDSGSTVINLTGAVLESGNLNQYTNTEGGQTYLTTEATLTGYIIGNNGQINTGAYIPTISAGSPAFNSVPEPAEFLLLSVGGVMLLCCLGRQKVLA